MSAFYPLEKMMGAVNELATRNGSLRSRLHTAARHWVQVAPGNELPDDLAKRLAALQSELAKTPADPLEQIGRIGSTVRKMKPGEVERCARQIVNLCFDMIESYARMHGPLLPEGNKPLERPVVRLSPEKRAMSENLRAEPLPPGSFIDVGSYNTEAATDEGTAAPAVSNPDATPAHTEMLAADLAVGPSAPRGASRTKR